MTTETAIQIRDSYFAAVAARPVWSLVPVVRQEHLKAEMRLMRRECLIAAKERGYPAAKLADGGVSVPAGAKAWSTFVETKASTIEAVMLVLCELTDPTSTLIAPSMTVAPKV